MKPTAPALYPEPEYLRAFATIMSRIERALGPKRPPVPVIACVAGGAALHFYTGSRISTDIDAKVLARIILDPHDLQVAYRDADGHARLLYFDTQYNDTFALLHEDAYDEAIPIDLEGVDPERLLVKLLTPLDLAVSKLSRFSEQDQLDIRALARSGLIEAVALRRRALTALPDYVGNLDRIKSSIEIACRILEDSGGKKTARVTRRVSQAGKRQT
ncbi:MAG: DUF6036 family nucleotidyltransferase [Casimicrobiaceae bacterium]